MTGYKEGKYNRIVKIPEFYINKTTYEEHFVKPKHN